jgi:predicted NBD/HSP70 family sugar kinase
MKNAPGRTITLHEWDCYLYKKRLANDAEDAFGHMVINVDGEACSCGNYGCIDCYSSIYRIILEREDIGFTP